MCDQENKSKRYVIKPAYKKSACEEQLWRNNLKSGKCICKVGNLYRGGSFYIDLTDEQKSYLLKEDSIVLNDYEDFELIELWDGGCDFWVNIIDEDSYSQSEQEEINDLV